MAKKIMVLLASPVKKGNTRQLVDWIAKGAKGAGAAVEVVDVATLKYKANGCRACMDCQTLKEFRCVVKDKASAIIARIPKADVLVFATPLYFFGPSAQLKLFMDRMYSLFKFDEATREVRHNLGHLKFALVATANGQAFKPLIDTFAVISGLIRVPLLEFCVPFAGRSGNIRKLEGIEQKARQFGKSLAGA